MDTGRAKKTLEVSAVFAKLDTLTSMQDVYSHEFWSTELSQMQRFKYLIHRWGALKAYSLFLAGFFMVCALPFALFDLFGFEKSASQRATPASTAPSSRPAENPVSIEELNASNEDDCLKINRVPNDSFELIARKFQVPISSVRFLRASYSIRTGGVTAGYRGCNLYFDSAQGPIYCGVLDIYSNDGGKTAMGTFYAIGVSENANLCY